jgi:hypothetical protein
MNKTIEEKIMQKQTSFTASNNNIDANNIMPVNYSSMRLIDSKEDSTIIIDNNKISNSENQNAKIKICPQNILMMSLLFVINLIKYMDRFTIAGVLKETQEYFQIDNTSSGLMQTIFICSYMLVAPLFGYLGDRYQRKWIIIIGLTFWSSITFISSFIQHDVSKLNNYFNNKVF